MSGNTLSNILSVRKSKRWVISAAVLGAMALGASRADAGFSVIGKSKKASEATHQEILQNRFGTTFEQNGESFSGANGINVTRVDDSQDQSFTGDVNSVSVIAAFARKSQSFGFFDSTGGYHRLLKVEGRNFDVTGEADSENPLSGLGDTVVFGRGGGDPKFSADASQNPDGADHLVTYRVTGANVAPGTTLLFWEDSAGRQADFDYNDLVVEITASGEPLLIPLPAAAWSGLSGLVGLGVLAGYKKVRRRLA